MQYSSELYEDALFVIYEISNVSDKDLDKALIGFWGDPHIGGPDDWRDDWANFDRSLNIAYAWDDDGVSLNDPNITPGYFGLYFTQTAGNPFDGIDNDNDGLTDESPYNGIDDDGDWNISYDDLGQDGLPGTFDTGEGDGVPTVGEPNFEFRDVDETDMIGLTSFAQPLFSSLRISDDEKMWSNYLQPETFDTTEIQGDYIFLMSSGYFKLPAKTTIQLGVAFVFGDDKDDLFNNARRAQKIYNSRLGGLTSNVNSSLSTVDSGSVFSANLPVSWDNNNLPQDAEVQFFAKRQNGPWQFLGSDTTNSGSLSLDVSAFESSAFYTFKNRIVSSSAFGKKESPYFTIDNSGDKNVAPEIVPNLIDGITLSGEVKLEWLAADVDGDEFDVQVEVASNVASQAFQPDGSTLILQTENFPNNTYTIAYKISDPSSERIETRTVNFVNEIEHIDSTFIVHQKGFASGKVFASIIDQSALQGHFYKISFNDDNSEEIKYTVIDSTTGDTLIWNDDIEIAPNSGVLFDGVSLSFENNIFGYNQQKTGWKPGTQSDVLATIIHEKKYLTILADYEIRFFDVIMDTAVTNVLTPFQIWNIVENKKIKFAVTEKSNSQNGVWDLGETIFLLEGGTSAKDIAWQIIFNPDSSQTPPQNGDVFLLATDKPFSSGDIYLLDMSVLGIDGDEKTIADGFELFQNYPNPFNGQTTIQFGLRNNAPVQIEIFNTLGQRVFNKELGRLNAGQHRYIWNSINNQGNVISSGIYYYRIKVGKKLSRVSKMIILK